MGEKVGRLNNEKEWEAEFEFVNDNLDEILEEIGAEEQHKNIH